MPANAVYVGRPTLWGNPFVVGERFYFRVLTNGMLRATTSPRVVQDKVHAVDLYRRWLRTHHGSRVMAFLRSKLAGKDLACWCPLDHPCHADVLLELANQ